MPARTVRPTPVLWHSEYAGIAFVRIIIPDVERGMASAGCAGSEGDCNGSASGESRDPGEHSRCIDGELRGMIASHTHTTIAILA